MGGVRGDGGDGLRGRRRWALRTVAWALGWGWRCALGDGDGGDSFEAVARGPGTPTLAPVTSFRDDCDGSEAAARGPGTPTAPRRR
ncbi:hypothetical protein GUJ93_ZPchr0006g41197 [Zizania palustris]|uniref:Secreted protein n=1 Tax=Zizania palustris TaxID=103762 RepID=A0A8J5TGS0_ZIZPA|nr:hypothetical protein GUJ93_ZPchr0006g41197 [Zizania palustris]